MKTVRDVCNDGYCLPAKGVYFIGAESERRIAARLIHWQEPGWYSYDSSMYRAGKRAAFSQIELQRGHAGSGGVVEIGA